MKLSKLEILIYIVIACLFFLAIAYYCYYMRIKTENFKFSNFFNNVGDGKIYKIVVKKEKLFQKPEMIPLHVSHSSHGDLYYMSSSKRTLTDCFKQVGPNNRFKLFWLSTLYEHPLAEIKVVTVDGKKYLGSPQGSRTIVEDAWFSYATYTEGVMLTVNGEYIKVGSIGDDNDSKSLIVGSSPADAIGLGYAQDIEGNYHDNCNGTVYN